MKTETIQWGTYSTPALAGVHGAIQFEGPGGRAFMQVDDARVQISPSGAKADLTLRTEVPGELLRLVRGEVNMVTAYLRGDIQAEGDLTLAIQVAGSLRQLTPVFAKEK